MPCSNSPVAVRTVKSRSYTARHALHRPFNGTLETESHATRQAFYNTRLNLELKLPGIFHESFAGTFEEHSLDGELHGMCDEVRFRPSRVRSRSMEHSTECSTEHSMGDSIGHLTDLPMPYSIELSAQHSLKSPYLHSSTNALPCSSLSAARGSVRLFRIVYHDGCSEN